MYLKIGIVSEKNMQFLLFLGGEGVKHPKEIMIHAFF